MPPKSKHWPAKGQLQKLSDSHGHLRPARNSVVVDKSVEEYEEQRESRAVVEQRLAFDKMPHCGGRAKLIEHGYDCHRISRCQY